MIKLTTLTTLLLISTSSFAANVSNVSKESFAQYGKEDAYWIVSVSCDDESQHVVQRKTDGDIWCPKGSDSLCSENKETAYKNACSDTYLQQTKKAQTDAKRKAQEQQAARAAAEERRKLQDQETRNAEQKIQKQLSLEQERLALSKQQLDIDRRILEINEILKTEEEDDE